MKKMISHIGAILIFCFVSCSDQNEVQPDLGITKELDFEVVGVSNGDTVWNTFEVALRFNQIDFTPKVFLTVNGELYQESDSSSSLLINSREFEDGFIEVRVDVENDDSSLSQSQTFQVYVLNTLFTVETSSDYSENPFITRYLAIEDGSESVGEYLLQSGEIFQVLRPDDFNDSTVNYNIYTQVNIETGKSVNINSVKGFSDFGSKIKLGNFRNSGSVGRGDSIGVFEIAFENIPSKYDDHIFITPSFIFSGGSEGNGQRFYPFYNTTFYEGEKSLYAYIKQGDDGSYLFIDDLSTYPSNRTIDWSTEASNDMTYNQFSYEEGNIRQFYAWLSNSENEVPSLTYLYGGLYYLNQTNFIDFHSPNVALTYDRYGTYVEVESDDAKRRWISRSVEQLITQPQLLQAEVDIENETLGQLKIRVDAPEDVAISYRFTNIGPADTNGASITWWVNIEDLNSDYSSIPVIPQTIREEFGIDREDFVTSRSPIVRLVRDPGGDQMQELTISK